jgi:molybdopterin-guanine dinucleotide biosynthesis protein A
VAAARTPRFSGAILCGGASRRMGRDKALIPVDGQALAVRVSDALSGAGATEVIAVGGDLAALRSLGVPAVADADPGAGPLTGIVTALARSADDIVFVAACDLVNPSADAMVATVRALAADAGGDVAVPLVGGRRQWVHAAWRRRAAHSLGAAYAAGERAVHAAVAAAGLRVIDVAVDPAAVGAAPAAGALPGLPDDRPGGPPT